MLLLKFWLSCFVRNFFIVKICNWFFFNLIFDGNLVFYLFDFVSVINEVNNWMVIVLGFWGVRLCILLNDNWLLMM